MRLTSFFFLIIFYITRFQNLIAQTLRDFYPSFQRLDIYYDKISKNEKACPENCSECSFNDKNQMICTDCSPGFSLKSIKCYQCPDNCLNCFLFNEFWKEQYFCEETNFFYFFNGIQFHQCSPSCMKCESFSKCSICTLGFYLKYVSPGNYICASCFQNFNCNDCVFKNETNIISFEIYETLKTEESYQNQLKSNKWQMACRICPVGYFIKKDQLCYKCSDEILDCASCSSENVYDKPLLTCTSCLNNKFLRFYKINKNLISSCEECSSIIQNCQSCQYGLYLPMLDTIELYNYPFKISLFNDPNFSIRCNECRISFIFENYSFRNVCVSCASNCEFCYFEKEVPFCGRCKSGYVLNLDQGQCNPLSDYSNIDNDFLMQCSKIVSEHPLLSFNFYNYGPLLCQECVDINYYPSIKGSCSRCTNNCFTCYEKLSELNLTELIVNTPIQLREKAGFITLSLYNQGTVKCLSCYNSPELSPFAWSPITEDCCSPELAALINNEYKLIIFGCVECQRCWGGDLCSLCRTCSNLNENLLSNLNIISQVDQFSSYFGKRIYYELVNSQQKPFLTTPILNEYEIYRSILEDMIAQKQVDLEAGIYQCLPCPFNTLECFVRKDIKPVARDFEVQNDMEENIKYYTLMSYFLGSLKCRPNFIYDRFSKRCKFCPNRWRKCFAYKIIDVNFTKDASNSILGVTTLAGLYNLIKNLERSELPFIANEFLVKNIEINVILEKGADIIWQDENNFEFNFAVKLIPKIPSLINFKLNFISSDIEDKFSYNQAKIILACSIAFSGFTHVQFRNLMLQPLSSLFSNNIESLYILDDLIKSIPQLKIQSNMIEFYNCSYTFNNSEYFLLNQKFLKQTPENLMNTSFFRLNLSTFNLEASGEIVINNFIIENLISDISQSNYLNFFVFFDLNSETIFLSNIKLNNVQVSRTNCFFMLSLLNADYYEINNLTLNNSKIIECSIIKFYDSIIFNVSGIYLVNINVTQNSIISNQPKFKGSYSLMNIIIDNCFFSAGTTIMNLFHLGYFDRIQNLLIKNSKLSGTTIIKINFHFFKLPTTMEFKLENVLFLSNLIEYFKGQDSFLFQILNLKEEISINCRNFLFNKNNQTIQKNNFFAIAISSLKSFKGYNFNFINNFQINGLYLSDMDNVILKSFFFISTKINIAFFQNNVGLFISLILKKTLLELIVLEKMEGSEGLIKFENKIPVEEVGIIEITNFFAMDILLQSNILASTLYFDCVSNFTITINLAVFSKIALVDNSRYQGSTTAMSFFNPHGLCIIENSKFFDLISNGEANALYAFMFSLRIIQCNFSYANFFDEKNLSSLILSRGSFLNLNVANLAILDSNFLKAYGLVGGAIYCNAMREVSFISIAKSKFEYISSLNEGGMLYFLKNNEKASFIEITNCFFNNVLALSEGGHFSIKILGYSNFSIISSKITNFYAKSASILKANDINFNMFNTTIQKNYDVFYISIKIFFSQIIDREFQPNIGVLFFLTGVKINFSSNIFENLVSASNELEPTLLYCSYCQILEYGNLYKAIYFSKFGVYLESCEYYGENLFFIYLSGAAFSNSVLYDGNLNFIQKRNYLSFLQVINSNFSLLESKIKYINCELCEETSSFIFSYQSVINILFSNSSNNKGYYGPFLFSSSNVIIEGCIFNENQALFDGAGLKIDFTNLTIKNSSFFKNHAIKGRGGAIQFNSNKEGSLLIYNSSFIENTALIGGAIFYNEIGIFIDSSNRFRGNQGFFFGKNYFSYPFSLCFADESNFSNCSNTKPNFLNFRSGFYLSSFYIGILDEEFNPINYIDQTSNPSLAITMRIEKTLKNKIYSVNSSTILSNLQMGKNNFFLIENLKLIGFPETTIALEFSSPDIKANLSIINSIKQLRDFSIGFNVSFRNCIIGEYFQSSTGICFVCPAQTFSYDPSVENCKKCLDGLSCLGGAENIVNYGYWRNKKFSEYIFLCDKSDYGCVGGNEGGDRLCAIGHIGAKCESCDLTGKFWNVSFARTSDFGCARCDEITLNYLILGFISILTFTFLILSIMSRKNNIKTKLQLKVINALARYGMFPAIRNEGSIYIKIYFSYLQVMQVLIHLNLQYPEWVNSLGAIAGTPGNSVLYSFDCLISRFYSKIPYLYTKLIMGFFVPFFYLFSFFLFYNLIMRKSNRSYKSTVLYTVTLYTLLYFQPNIVENTISVLSCVPLGDEYYIKADMAFECYNEDYYFYSFLIGIPAFLMWALIAPLGIFLILFFNRNKLKTISYLARFGYFYDEYLIFYWEFIRMYEKILISLVISFYQTEIILKGLLVLFILITYLILLYRKQPYIKKNLNQADKFNSFICFVSIFFALLIYLDSFDYINVISYIIIILINILFNCFIFKQILPAYTGKIFKYLKKYPILHGIFIKKVKKWKTRAKWLKARRLVAKYLRERERWLNYEKTDDSIKFQLSIRHYDYRNAGIQKYKRAKEDERLIVMSENENLDEMMNENMVLQKDINTLTISRRVGVGDKHEENK